ncbi:MAG: transposase [Leptolyngbyaceae cyanobacterium]
MFPLVGIAASISQGMSAYRDLFSRLSAFEHVERYLNGLLLSANKTLQGIYSQYVWPEAIERINRRAMHAGVFESPWQREQLMERHRAEVSHHYEAQERQVISLDWTHGHHERGPQIFGVKRQYDYVNGRTSQYHTILTAVLANRERLDGIAVEVQRAKWEVEELAYLQSTTQDRYDDTAAVMNRLSELVAYQRNRQGYQKRTELFIEVVRQIEAEGQFPQADYAFDGGVCAAELTQVIEQADKHWVSELACNRSVLWHNQWSRIDAVAARLREESASAFRHYQVRQRNGEQKELWAFSKVLRLKKIGRKRVVMVHEHEDLSDSPRFLVTDALHWDVKRIAITWSYRWPCEIFHEFTKEICGLEAAQLRNEEAVKRHLCLSCLAQSMLQNAPVAGGKSERFSFATKTPSIGQKLYGLTREALMAMLQLANALFEQGQSVEQVVEVMMPI